MTSLPNTKVTIRDGGLGVAGQNLDGLHVKCGICSKGAFNTLIPVSDPTLLETTLGEGPLVEACAHSLNVAGGPVYALRVNPGLASTLSAVTPTRVGTSTGAIDTTGSNPVDSYAVRVEIIRAGTLGAASFHYSLDGQDTYSPEISVPLSGSYVDAAAGITLVFTPGVGPAYFDAGDVFDFTTTAPGFTTSDLVAALDALKADAHLWEYIHVLGSPAPQTSSVTKSGTGPTITITGTPLDFYDVKIEITLGGAIATATLKYSLDGGANYTTGVVSASTIALGASGLTANLPAGTYVLNDLYTFNTYTALAALAATASTKAQEMETAERDTFIVLEAPKATDAILTTAFSTFADKRIVVCAGTEELTSAISGRIDERSAALPFTARLSSIAISEDPAYVGRGNLPGVVSLHRDEFKTEALDSQRFTTLRSILGEIGFFVTNGKTMGPVGTDFDLIQNLRVMNKACRVVRAALRKYQSSSVRVDATTGYIFEADARAIEGVVEGKLRAEMGADVSDVQVVLSRTDNLLSTRKLNVSVGVIPLAYLKFINATIGFLNPALTKV